MNLDNLDTSARRNRTALLAQDPTLRAFAEDLLALAPRANREDWVIQRLVIVLEGRYRVSALEGTTTPNLQELAAQVLGEADGGATES